MYSWVLQALVSVLDRAKGTHYLLLCSRSTHLPQSQLKGCRLDDAEFVVVNNAFERSLTYMHKYPLIWLEYLDFLESYVPTSSC